MKNKVWNDRLDLNLGLASMRKWEPKEYMQFLLYFHCYSEAVRSIFFNALKEVKEEHKDILEKDKSSIYSFMGVRGSGKTTAMREFCRVLENINKREEYGWWIDQVLTEESWRIQARGETFYFKTMEPIDASSLEVKEDLFELILAGLYREYKKTVKKEKDFLSGRHPDTEVLELFEQVIEGYHAVKNARNEEFGDSFIARLEYMSSSVTIRNKIAKLIEALLKKWGGTATKRFLVIAIDDLDLNIQNGYEMLEQLRKYFFHKNIIIALAVDYGQINRVCEMHYLKDFSAGMREQGRNLPELTGKLSKDYITKVLPVDKRMFMPEMKNMVVWLEEDKQMSIKKFLMTEIGRKMRIFYDICGMKRHFCEAHNVREMIDYWRFLATLLEVDFERWNSPEIKKEEREIWMERYDINHKRFNRDITNRMANRLLNEEYERIFEWLLQRELERRAVYVCGTAKARIHNKMSGLSDAVVYEEERKEYSYGVFLETIHELGRISDMDKNMIKCLLASFTSEMVREHISYLNNTDQDARCRALDRLKQFLGKSFGSRWTGEMMPVLNGDAKEEGFGYLPKLQMERVKAMFLFEGKQWKDFLMKEERGTTVPVDELVDEFCRWAEEERLIPTLECLFMFFLPEKSGKESVQYHVKLGWDYHAKSSGGCYLTVQGGKEVGTLDIFGFIKNTIDYENQYRENHEHLAKALTEGIVGAFQEHSQRGFFESERGEINEKILLMVKENSIHKKLSWAYKNQVAFPFYDVDLSYNVMKRVRDRLKNSRPAGIAESACYEWIENAYKEMISHLKEEVAAYGGTDSYYTETLNPHYAEIFCNCPYVRAFLNPKDYLHPDFSEKLGACIAIAIEPNILREDDESESMVDLDWDDLELEELV